MAERPGSLKILYLEDDPRDEELLRHALEKRGLAFELRRVDRLEDFDREREAWPPDLVLADFRLQGFTALPALERVRRADPEIPFILFSGVIGEEEAVGRLAGGIAHDFNNILTALSGYGELLLAETPRQSPAREHAEEILKAADRASRLCRRLLAFSRRHPVLQETLDLGAVIADLQGMLSPILGSTIDLQVPARVGRRLIHFNRNQLEQVVVNLAVNARDAMPQGGQLTLETLDVMLGNGEERPPGDLTPGPYVLLRVYDTGTGMSPDVLARLFEPFFSTKDEAKGSGLGLSIVHGIVNEAGGHIEVSSLPGEGSVFSVYFPAVAPPPWDGKVPDAPARSESILVVAEAFDIRHLVRRILENKGGYRVREASSAIDALLELATHHQEIRLLLTDMVLPGARGLEWISRARKIRPDLKIIVMSNLPELSTAGDIRAMAAGLITTPFTIETLVRAVEAALAR